MVIVWILLCIVGGKNQISFYIFPDLDKNSVWFFIHRCGFEWLFLPSPYPKIFTIVNDFSKYSVSLKCSKNFSRQQWNHKVHFLLGLQLVHAACRGAHCWPGLNFPQALYQLLSFFQAHALTSGIQLLPIPPSLTRVWNDLQLLSVDVMMEILIDTICQKQHIPSTLTIIYMFHLTWSWKILLRSRDDYMTIFLYWRGF